MSTFEDTHRAHGAGLDVAKIASKMGNSDMCDEKPPKRIRHPHPVYAGRGIFHHARGGGMTQSSFSAAHRQIRSTYSVNSAVVSVAVLACP
jgi:hypothetical protein